jgi:uncharacterized membrane protein
MTKSSQITRMAVISAIVFLGFAIDTLLRNAFAFQIAVVSLIAVLTVVVTCPLKEGLVAGIALGVFSMLRAFVMPSAGAALTMENFWISFTNPLIAVLPRALIGLTAKFTFIKVKKWTKNHTLSVACSSFIGVATNTVCVCIVMLVMKTIFVPNFALWDFIVTFFTINCIIEIAVCTVVVPMLVKGLSRSNYFKGDNK